MLSSLFTGFPAPGTPSCHPNLAHFCCNPNPNLICLPSFPNPEDVDLIVALAMEEGGSHNYDAAPTKTFQAIAGVKESSTYPASQGQFRCDWIGACVMPRVSPCGMAISDAPVGHSLLNQWPNASALSASGTAPVQSHCTPQVSSLTAPEMDEADNVGDNEETSVGRPKRRRIRSEVQQEQNKAAQQRYRERKKQKATKLEHTVQDLNEQIKDLEKFKAENAGLQEKKTQLEAELLEKDAQIKRLNVG